jgi:hypothetical protein
MGVFPIRDWRIRWVFTIGVYYRVYIIGVYHATFSMGVYHCPPSPYFMQYLYKLLTSDES